VLYFAYGSNLDGEQMRESCPGARLRHPSARLDGYELDFRRRSQRWQAGAADIVARAQASVCGCVWELAEEEVAALDVREGVAATPPGYRRLNVTVVAGREAVAVFTYTVVEKSPVALAPTIEYARLMVDGARERGLPLEYQTQLRATLELLGVSV
jgi:gamma-glutamylcyclotransferase (GGCT)/AIG2-like uncharacterized protein YtfP